MARKMSWVYSPSKAAKPKLPESLKLQVEAEANNLIETALKPAHLRPAPEEPRFNYITDLYGKWYRSYFYFCATYACPYPEAIAPSFEIRFARLEYIGGSRFALAYMRHTEQWWTIYDSVTLEEALNSVRDEPHFQP